MNFPINCHAARAPVKGRAGRLAGLTLLWLCVGGQRLSKLGPACVSGSWALARHMRVFRTPHSFMCCRSLRSSHRFCSGGLHCGGTCTQAQTGQRGDEGDGKDGSTCSVSYSVTSCRDPSVSRRTLPIPAGSSGVPSSGFSWVAGKIRSTNQRPGEATDSKTTRVLMDFCSFSPEKLFHQQLLGSEES